MLKLIVISVKCNPVPGKFKMACRNQGEKPAYRQLLLHSVQVFISQSVPLVQLLCLFIKLKEWSASLLLFLVSDLKAEHYCIRNLFSPFSGGESVVLTRN